MQDFQILPFNFASTEVTIAANSVAAQAELARRFGAGCVSFQVRKSEAPTVAENIEALGFTIQ